MKLSSRTTSSSLVSLTCIVLSYVLVAPCLTSGPRRVAADSRETKESFVLDPVEPTGRQRGKRRSLTTPSHVRSSSTTTVQTETIGVYVPNSATFDERNSNTGGAPDTTFSYGASG